MTPTTESNGTGVIPTKHGELASVKPDDNGKQAIVWGVSVVLEMSVKSASTHSFRLHSISRHEQIFQTFCHVR